MKKYRLEKFNSLVHREIADILQQNVNLEKGTFLSVIRTEVCNDISHAKIFVAVYPDRLRQNILNQLNGQIYHLQQIFNKRMPFKIVPKLTFILDASQDKVQNMYKILH